MSNAASSFQPSDEEIQSVHTTLYTMGSSTSRSVFGSAHVDRSLATDSSSFSAPMQELATELAWGAIWTRPGLTRQQRSLLNIGVLCALARSHELGVYVRGAIRNELSTMEIREAILQVSVDVGMPAGLKGTRVAERVLREMVEEGDLKEGEL